MATSTLAAPSQPQSPRTDRLDAAHALLGVAPHSSGVDRSESNDMDSSPIGDGDDITSGTDNLSASHEALSCGDSPRASSSANDANNSVVDGWDSALRCVAQVSNRPNGCALDALAALASSAAAIEQAASSSDESMPPPPPRLGRARSASNPEGMEKWDSLSSSRYGQNRRHFVLPDSILEEELASANAAAAARNAGEGDVAMSEATEIVEPETAKECDTDGNYSRELPFKKRNKMFSASAFGTSPDSVMTSMDICPAPSSLQSEDKDETSSSSTPSSRGTDQADEADMDPAELLRRARSRLLEDLSEGSLNGEKGVLTLPHCLSKYKEVYNKNGRIGIYTPAERAAIIARFNSKRTRRVWNKKIRYNCRKNLADRRMRVKGRFVKRSTEIEALAARQHTEDISSESREELESSASVMEENEEVPPPDSPSTSNSPITTPPCTPPHGPLPPVCEEGDNAEMLDVNNTEAGFEPSEDQPYRRTRRHTIS